MHRVCFIDDDEDFEIDLFERVFKGTYNVIAESSYEAAKHVMSDKWDRPPDLFVLDLYFPKGQPDRDAVGALLQSRVTYGNDRGGIRAAYTNYLRAESRLRAVLCAWRQGPDGGLEIAQRVAGDYPNVPIVFYSRKATFEDSVRCMACPGVWWVEKKPSGETDQDTVRITFEDKQRLVNRFDAIIAQTDRQETAALKKVAGTIWRFIRRMLEDSSDDT